MTQALLKPYSQPPRKTPIGGLPAADIPPHRLAQNSKLTPAQLRASKLAELPQNERESVEQFRADSRYPEQWELNCIHEGNISDNSHSGAPIRGLTWLPKDKDRPWVHRDWLRAELKKSLPEVEFQSLNENGYWAYQDALKSCLKLIGNIHDTDFKPFREHNFHQCSNRKSFASLLTYEGGEQRVVTRRCSERLCPSCTDYEANKRARDTFDYIKAVAETGLVSRMWHMVFTLPREIEAELAKGGENRKQVLKGLQQVVRKVFGLKTRDTIMSYVNVHAVGDSDPFRTRYHIHVGIVPIALSKNQRTKKNELKQCDVTGLLDRVQVNDLWHEVLASVFNGVRRDKMNVRLSFMPLTEWTDRSGVKRPVKWGAVRHRVKYDMRGFGADMLKAPIFYAPAEQLAVVQKGDGYQVVSVMDIAERWKWLRGERDLRMWGALRKRETYAELFGLELAEEPEPEVQAEDEAIVRRRRGRVWDAEKRRVIWVNTKQAFRLKDGREILIPPDVKYGRIGGSRWRLKE